jgi:hypothetical protein
MNAGATVSAVAAIHVQRDLVDEGRDGHRSNLLSAVRKDERVAQILGHPFRRLW